MSAPGRQSGLSYVEVLVAAVILAIALIPAIEALQVGLQGATAHEAVTRQHYHLASRMAELMAEPFAALDAEAQALGDPDLPSSYSDAPATPMRRLVYLSRYDGDDADTDDNPFTGVDDGLLWLRIEIEGEVHALESLRAR